VDRIDLIIRNMKRQDEGSYPEWLDDQVGGQFYAYVTGTANLTCQAEAEPHPKFTWIDAKNIPVGLTRITR
jgi:hypothetical protein